VDQLVGDRKRKTIRPGLTALTASPCTSMEDLQAIDWRIQYADGTTKIKMWELGIDFGFDLFIIY
jgi:hypothetical protein